MQLIEVEFIPEQLEEGKFYYSEKYQTASHLCACGCGQNFPVPIKQGEWNITKKEPLTVTPSFCHRIQCMSHYIITDGFANIVNIPREKRDWYNQIEFTNTHAPYSCPM